MKKKTYKQMQNRLYREIKRRIQAENALVIPKDISFYKLPVDTIKTIKMINNIGIPAQYLDKSFYEDCIRHEMAQDICNELLDKGYIVFYTEGSPISSVSNYSVIEARLKVVRDVN